MGLSALYYPVRPHNEAASPAHSEGAHTAPTQNHQNTAVTTKEESLTVLLLKLELRLF